MCLKIRCDVFGKKIWETKPDLMCSPCNKRKQLKSNLSRPHSEPLRPIRAQYTSSRWARAQYALLVGQARGGPPAILLFSTLRPPRDQPAAEREREREIERERIAMASRLVARSRRGLALALSRAGAGAPSRPSPPGLGKVRRRPSLVPH